ncbi:MAG TPA: YbfB/YjiJ family MFS transporter [Candidatus Competibacteraceae bacterium]|nr:MAG: YbfB/YjiJ family MFS transporter [Candidatus Competibacteraceae bacterium]HOB61198.1 YbfB/YjiJ family MFS transporter [Candidatus Competibacteraceae bacterium]HQA24725.1 YbfB/YjiJ family MFS transporter [Candidatus Competibacteraceae bacterium]HQD55521.1 YbfB/YjiJ family MFS transporter [Candidatus Competibacteraceae bacterium]
MTTQLERLKVLAAGICSLMLVLGVARFAYTPLLPLMQHQAGLGVAAAGWLAAINYAGYLSGALIASLINDLVLKDRLYRIGMVVAVASTALMGLTTDPTLWAVSRFFAGLSSAAGMLLGTGLILNWLMRHDHRSELGIHFSGLGLGIVGCAAAVALMSQWLDWREQWFAFVGFGGLLLIPALGWLPAPDRSAMTKTGQMLVDKPPSPLFLRLLMAAYFCAGIGYVVSATFIVAIVDRLPGLAGQGTLVFLAIGAAAAPACIAWDFIARRTGEINALLLAAVLQIAGILLPVTVGGLPAALAGALLFGGTFIGTVSLVLTMAGRYYPTRPAKMMGKMTLAYGAAQIIGPAVTGWLAAHWGSYASGLYLAAGVMAAGALLLLALRVVESRKDSESLAGLEPCLQS